MFDKQLPKNVNYQNDIDKIRDSYGSPTDPPLTFRNYSVFKVETSELENDLRQSQDQQNDT